MIPSQRATHPSTRTCHPSKHPIHGHGWKLPCQTCIIHCPLHFRQLHAWRQHPTSSHRVCRIAAGFRWMRNTTLPLQPGDKEFWGGGRFSRPCILSGLMCVGSLQRQIFKKHSAKLGKSAQVPIFLPSAPLVGCRALSRPPNFPVAWCLAKTGSCLGAVNHRRSRDSAGPLYPLFIGHGHEEARLTSVKCHEDDCRVIIYAVPP